MDAPLLFFCVLHMTGKLTHCSNRRCCLTHRSSRICFHWQCAPFL